MKVIEFWDVITCSLRENSPLFPKYLLPKSSGFFVTELDEQVPPKGWCLSTRLYESHPRKQ
jgi:hypothetical protein